LKNEIVNRIFQSWWWPRVPIANVSERSLLQFNGIYRCWSVRVRVHGQVAAAAVQDFYLHFSSVLTGCLLSVQCWYASCMFAWVEFFCSRISAFTVAKNVFLSCISSAMLLTYDADVAVLSVRASICLSVTFRYSCRDIFAKFQRGHPIRGRRVQVWCIYLAIFCQHLQPRVSLHTFFFPVKLHPPCEIYASRHTDHVMDGWIMAAAAVEHTHWLLRVCNSHRVYASGTSVLYVSSPMKCRSPMAAYTWHR